MDPPGPAGCEEYEGYRSQHLHVGDTRSMALIAVCSRGCRWTGRSQARLAFADFPNEVLLHILSYLDISDLLATSRVSAVSLPLRCESLVQILPFPPFFLLILPPSLSLQRVQDATCDTTTVTQAWLQHLLTRKPRRHAT